ncbi:MAG: hypothetical protein ACKO34_04850, partial [Vampirovibrionales bacterium]
MFSNASKPPASASFSQPALPINARQEAKAPPPSTLPSKEQVQTNPTIEDVLDLKNNPAERPLQPEVLSILANQPHIPSPLSSEAPLAQTLPLALIEAKQNQHTESTTHHNAEGSSHSTTKKEKKEEEGGFFNRFRLFSDEGNKYEFVTKPSLNLIEHASEGALVGMIFAYALQIYQGLGDGNQQIKTLNVDGKHTVVVLKDGVPAEVTQSTLGGPLSGILHFFGMKKKVAEFTQDGFKLGSIANFKGVSLREYLADGSTRDMTYNGAGSGVIRHYTDNDTVWEHAFQKMNNGYHLFKAKENAVQGLETAGQLDKNGRFWGSVYAAIGAIGQAVAGGATRKANQVFGGFFQEVEAQYVKNLYGASIDVIQKISDFQPDIFFKQLAKIDPVFNARAFVPKPMYML